MMLNVRLRAAKRIGETERVQKSPAEWTGAVIEVVHEDLQLDGEIHVVHRGAERGRDHLGREVEQPVDIGLYQQIGDFLGRLKGVRKSRPPSRGRLARLASAPRGPATSVPMTSGSTS